MKNSTIIILLILAIITGIFGFTGFEINIMEFSTSNYIEVSKILFYIFALLLILAFIVKLIQKKH